MRLRLTYAIILFSGIILTTLIPVGRLYSQLSEKRLEYRGLIPQSRVVINYPEGRLLKKSRDTRIIFYALPNGNSIEQTEGENIRDSLVKAKEWRYDIQHIAAQVRFLRENDRRYNYVVVYLESETKAWTSHASAYPESPALYRKLVDTVRFMVERELSGIAPLHRQRVVMACHSGGGRFVFNYIRGYDSIPAFVERFAFIDSNYGYETELHSGKLSNWLKEKPSARYLGVYAYVDTTVILDGKRIVSSKGGTGYRANLMAADLKSKGLKMKESRDSAFVSYRGRGVEVLIKENPKGKIYHTVLVERNGLIHMLLSGSPLEKRGYNFWGDRSYNQFITERARN